MLYRIHPLAMRGADQRLYPRGVIERAKRRQRITAIIQHMMVKIVAAIDRQEGARQNIETAGFGFAALLTSSDLGIHEAAGDQPHTTTSSQS